MNDASNVADRKVAVVTGAGSGIGRAIAQRLSSDGFIVAVLDANLDGADETVALIVEAGGIGATYTVDVSDNDRVEAVFKAVGYDLGPVAVLVAAAGIFDQNADFDDLTAHTWQRVMDVNVLGMANCVRPALREMKKVKSGVIVTLASSAGLVPRGGGSAYIASKHAVVGMTLKLAAEAAAFGVRVNAVAPGWIPTSLFSTSAAALRAHNPSGSIPDVPSPVGGTVPMVRPGETDEVAAGVSFLVSDQASYITGTVLPIDGGYLVG